MSNRVAFPGFVGSAFSAQCKRLDTQDLWNWYVERAGSPYAKSPQALLPCPGFELFTTLPTAPVRGLFAQNDKAFAIAGDRLYQLDTVGGYLERPMTVVATPAAPTVTQSPLLPPLIAPTVAPVLTHGGATGSTTYGYEISAINGLGETTPTPEGRSDLGNATLSGTNWNIVSWQAVQGATGYKVYLTSGPASPTRTVPVLLATLAATTLVFHDIGPAGTAATPPTTNTTGGTIGATPYHYVVTALLGLGESAASPDGTTTTGKATLSSTSFNTVTWTKVVNARGYNVYRTAGGPSPPRLIETVIGKDTLDTDAPTLSVKDVGQEGEPTAPPTTNTTGTTAIANDGTIVNCCSSGDAGEQLFFVSANTAYCYDFERNILAPVVQGASSAGFIDSYFVVLDASESALKVSESFDGFTWDPTQAYQRSRAGDKWLAMAVTSNNIWLIGTQTGEVWVGTGDTENRFAPYSPVFIEVGVIAADTMIRVSGDTMMWVAQDKDGAGYVVQTNGYAPQKVSTAAVDQSIQNLSVLADGYAFSYQQEGHTFYVVTFPAAETTWVFDLATREWHRRGYWDPNAMQFLAYRPQCHAFVFGAVSGFGQTLVGDRLSGRIAELHCHYGLDMDGAVIRRVRQCPHLSTHDEEMTFDRLQMDMEVGEGQTAVDRRLTRYGTPRQPVPGQGDAPSMMLTYSNDGGNTWGSELWRSAGREGQYRLQVAWSRLGTAKNRVFRLVVSDPAPWRLVGAWLEMERS